MSVILLQKGMTGVSFKRQLAAGRCLIMGRSILQKHVIGVNYVNYVKIIYTLINRTMPIRVAPSLSSKAAEDIFMLRCLDFARHEQIYGVI